MKQIHENMNCGTHRVNEIDLCEWLTDMEFHNVNVSS